MHLHASTQAGIFPTASRSSQKLHFSTTPRSLVGKFGVEFRLDIGARVSEIEAPGAVGATGHAVPAADAAVEVHQRDPIGPFKGGLGRANPHAGGILALIAKDHEGLFPYFFGFHAAFLPGEDVLILFLPDPLDLFFLVPISGTL